MKITTTVPGSVKCDFTEVECERPVLNVPIRLVLGQAADWESYDVHFELSDDDEILDHLIGRFERIVDCHIFDDDWHDPLHRELIKSFVASLKLMRADLSRKEEQERKDQILNTPTSIQRRQLELVINCPEQQTES